MATLLSELFGGMKTLKELHAKLRKWMEGGPRRQPTRQARLGFELLERREVPATYGPIVTATSGLFVLAALPVS
jgi:hypothetical protein